MGLWPWVERLGGNPKFAAHYLANDTNQGTTVESMASYDAFASVVRASNAKFEPATSPTITFTPSNVKTVTTYWQSGDYVEIVPNGPNTSDT